MKEEELYTETHFFSVSTQKVGLYKFSNICDNMVHKVKCVLNKIMTRTVIVMYIVFIFFNTY